MIKKLKRLVTRGERATFTDAYGTMNDGNAFRSLVIGYDGTAIAYDECGEKVETVPVSHQCINDGTLRVKFSNITGDMRFIERVEFHSNGYVDTYYTNYDIPVGDGYTDIEFEQEIEVE